MNTFIDLMGPFGLFKQAYTSTRVHLPSLLGLKLERNSKEFIELIKEAHLSNIESELRLLLTKYQIRKDIVIFGATHNEIEVGCFGTNYFTQGDAGIFTIPEFHEEDKEANLWVLKHEIAHIKNNDLFLRPIIVAITTVAVAIFCLYVTSISYSIFIAYNIGELIHIIINKNTESNADDFAITESSIEELKGGRRYLKIQVDKLLNRKTLWDKIFIASDGDERFNLKYPSWLSRLKKIEKTLKDKKININDAEENPKIEKLRQFINNHRCKIYPNEIKNNESKASKIDK